MLPEESVVGIIETVKVESVLWFNEDEERQRGRFIWSSIGCYACIVFQCTIESNMRVR